MLDLQIRGFELNLCKSIIHKWNQFVLEIQNDLEPPFPKHLFKLLLFVERQNGSLIFLIKVWEILIKIAIRPFDIWLMAKMCDRVVKNTDSIKINRPGYDIRLY